MDQLFKYQLTVGMQMSELEKIGGEENMMKKSLETLLR
jgi:hypothetical protein